MTNRMPHFASIAILAVLASPLLAADPDAKPKKPPDHGCLFIRRRALSSSRTAVSSSAAFRRLVALRTP